MSHPWRTWTRKPVAARTALSLGLLRRRAKMRKLRAEGTPESYAAYILGSEIRRHGKRSLA